MVVANLPYFSTNLYKEKRIALMKKYILQLANSKEFFIQKGAGWALRQYSKRTEKGLLNLSMQIRNYPLTKRKAEMASTTRFN
ncbi:MAG: DNA alkylation repair protein [Saprospiraceae bacterium]